MKSLVTALCLCAAGSALLPAVATAQPKPPCPPAPKLEASSISVDTKTALDAVGQLLGKIGLDVSFKTTRDSVLKDNPNADQVVIVLTMANTFCQMIWSDTTLSGADKATRFSAMMQDMLSRALGPRPVARTDAPATGHLHRSGPRHAHAAGSMFKRTAGAELPPAGVAGYELPEPRSGLLRDPPFYVTDANKYFVIVGSARSREDGERLMKRLKAKAPQHDFVLYAPYGANPYYGVMMATWVPRDVALGALKAARADVVADAYLWACRGSGESC